MREISEIHFETGSEADARDLVERYVLDAVERLPGTDHCEYAAFTPLSYGPHDDVWLVVAGDGDAIVDEESVEWDALVEAGLVSAWDVRDVTDERYASTGERGGELQLRLHRVANRTTRAAVEEFDEAPAAVDAYPEEESDYPVGWWTLLHIVAVHQEYSPEETLSMFLQGVRESAEDVAGAGTADEAADRIDDCIESLETLRGEIER